MSSDLEFSVSGVAVVASMTDELMFGKGSGSAPVRFGFKASTAITMHTESTIPVARISG